LFRVPKNESDNPWEYADSQFEVAFVQGYDLSYGIPCEEVEGYDDSTLEAASLKRSYNNEEGTAFPYKISYCSPTGTFNVTGSSNGFIEVQTK
jgi:hypothetical protein